MVIGTDSRAVVAAKRRVGRPRRLTLEQVIEAVIDIGLDQVDMMSVAQRLGIGVATLYGYVDDREHLVRLVSDRLAHRPAIEDRGQSWDDALREHAERTFQVYLRSPRLISQLMTGLLGDLADTDYVESLLRTLADRGIAAGEAFALFLEVNQLVLGAAVGATYVAALEDQAGGRDRYAAMAAEACERLGRSHLRTALTQTDLPQVAADFRPGLERLIAAQRSRMTAS